MLLKMNMLKVVRRCSIVLKKKKKKCYLYIRNSKGDNARIITTVITFIEIRYSDWSRTVI